MVPSHATTYNSSGICIGIPKMREMQDQMGSIFLKKCTAYVGLKNSLAMLTNIQNELNDRAPIARNILVVYFLYVSLPAKKMIVNIILLVLVIE